MAGTNLAAEITTVSVGRQEPENVGFLGRWRQIELVSHWCLSFIPPRRAQAAGWRGRGIARRHGCSASVVLRQRASRAIFPARSRAYRRRAFAVRAPGA